MSEGIVLIHWAEKIRERALSGFREDWQAVFPVIVAHANAEGLAWPSLDRIAVLAGVNKETARNALAMLQKYKWLVIERGQTRNGLPKNSYRVDVYRAGIDDPREWIGIGRELIKGGAWAVFPPSARRAYFVLKSLASVGRAALPGGFCGYVPGEGLAESLDPDQANGFAEDTGFDPMEVAFLPAGRCEPKKLRELAGLNERTWRRAMDWLIGNGMAFWAEENWDCEPGLIIPFEPRRVAPAVQERLTTMRIKAKIEGISPGARRAMTAARKKRIGNSTIKTSCCTITGH